MTLTNHVILTLVPDEGIIEVEVPALPGVLSWGTTIDEALLNAQEAIMLLLESFPERGQPFPPDRHPRGESVQIEIVVPTIAAQRSA